MRSVLTSVLMVCSAVGGMAQPTLTFADMPVPGQSVVYRLFDSIPPLASGADVTWVIDTSGANPVTDTVTFFTATDQPGSIDFPDATVAATMSLDPAYRFYYRTTPTAFEYLGFHITGVASFPEDPGRYLQLPCSEGTAWMDTWGQPGETIDVTLAADGWGTFIAEGNEWNNVLKVHGEAMELDTVVSGVHLEEYVTMDFFWRLGEPFYVAYVHRREYLVDGVPDTDISKTHGRVSVQMLNGTAEHARSNTITAFPNPATDHLSVSGAMHLAAITLIDLTGRVVKHEATASLGNVHQLDVHDVARGTYLVRCADPAGQISSVLVVLR